MGSECPPWCAFTTTMDIAYILCNKLYKDHSEDVEKLKNELNELEQIAAHELFAMMKPVSGSRLERLMSFLDKCTQRFLDERILPPFFHRTVNPFLYYDLGELMHDEISEIAAKIDEDVLPALLDRRVGVEWDEREDLLRVLKSFLDDPDLMQHHNFHYILGMAHGSVELLKILKQYPAWDPNQVAEDGWKGLHSTASEGYVEGVKFFLQCDGIELNAGNGMRPCTALHEVCFSGKARGWPENFKECARLLIDAGIDTEISVNVLRAGGESEIKKAVECSGFETFDFLFE